MTEQKDRCICCGLYRGCDCEESKALAWLLDQPSPPGFSAYETAKWLVRYRKAMNVAAIKTAWEKAIGGYHPDFPPTEDFIAAYKAGAADTKSQTPKTCVWTRHDDTEYFDSGCGESWVFTRDFNANNVHYCPNCSGRIEAE
jgi:hypothetical protein